MQVTEQGCTHFDLSATTPSASLSGAGWGHNSDGTVVCECNCPEVDKEQVGFGIKPLVVG